MVLNVRVFTILLLLCSVLAIFLPYISISGGRGPTELVSGIEMIMSYKDDAKFSLTIVYLVIALSTSFIGLLFLIFKKIPNVYIQLTPVILLGTVGYKLLHIEIPSYLTLSLSYGYFISVITAGLVFIFLFSSEDKNKEEIKSLAELSIAEHIGVCGLILIEISKSKEDTEELNDELAILFSLLKILQGGDEKLATQTLTTSEQYLSKSELSLEEDFTQNLNKIKQMLNKEEHQELRKDVFEVLKSITEVGGESTTGQVKLLGKLEI